MKAVVCLSLCLGISFYRTASAESFHYSPFGDVRVFRGASVPERVALLISGAAGWGPRDSALARGLADSGNAWILGVDMRVYLRDMASTHGKCAYCAADFDGLSHFGQKLLGLSDYRMPVLIGSAEGGAMAYAILAQSPPATFAGAVSLGFCPRLVSPKRLCPGTGLTARDRREGTEMDLLPFPGLSQPWTILLDTTRGGGPVGSPREGSGGSQNACAVDSANAFVAVIAKAKAIDLPDTSWLTAVRSATRAFARIAPGGAPPEPRASGLPRELPLVEVPAEGPRAPFFAILLTGDGGWAGIDRDLAKQLSRRGIPVVGWNSLKYLWKRKSEARASQDLAEVIQAYGERWHASKVALLGYSLGADGLPAMAARLPDSLKQRISLIGLMGVETRYDLEFHITEWIPGKPEGVPVLPELRKLKGLHIICVYGTDEKGSLCPELAKNEADKSLAEVKSFTGGHHFGGDYKALADALFPPVP
ncbi:MAG: virulence factor family protein [Fibrobacteres bacterium]|nr:virulence factor family protein [Fibrobacterota bacterium]